MEASRSRPRSKACEGQKERAENAGCFSALQGSESARRYSHGYSQVLFTEPQIVEGVLTVELSDLFLAVALASLCGDRGW